MEKPKWKNGASCAVSLSFDVDGESLWISKDPLHERRPGVLSQGAYGPKVGVGLILDLLKKHCLPATFFVPGWIAEQYPKVIEKIHEDGHEIGHHGYKHEWPDSDNPDVEKSVLEKGMEALRKITGISPTGYRSPAWELTDNTLTFLKEKDFIYSSNLMDNFIPYSHPGGIIEIPVQWALDDAPYFMFQTRLPSRPIWPPSTVLKAWEEEFHGIYHYNALFNLTLHPQFIGRPGRLLMLEQLIVKIRSYPDVWMASLGEIAAHWKKVSG